MRKRRPEALSPDAPGHGLPGNDLPSWLCGFDPRRPTPKSFLLTGGGASNREFRSEGALAYGCAMAKELAALGCRSHSGWAVIVVVAGSPVAPRVLDRRRVELLDGSVNAHPFHEAAEAGLAAAEATILITKVEELAATSAAAALATIVTAIELDGYRVAGVAVVATDRAMPRDLDRLLRSHALLHAAEGDLYEEALTEGAGRSGLLVERVTPASTSSHPNVEALGRVIGPPWQKDHKLAASAAFTLLARAAPDAV